MAKRQPKELSNTTVAITGGARGIGAATAKAFANEGATVAIGDLDEQLAQQTAQALAKPGHGFHLDVTDRASFERFVDEVETTIGPIDVLINNAGIMPVGPFLEEHDETTQRIVEINCHGVINGMKTILPRFKARDRGHLVNIASIVGKAAVPGTATYSGSKFFVVGVTEAVRTELSGTNIDVSCVMPGPVNTELTAGIPTGPFIRYIEPHEVAGAIVAAVQRPRFDVYVPRSLAGLTLFGYLLPRKARDGLGKLLKADTAVQRTDWAARREYEARAARETAKTG